MVRLLALLLLGAACYMAWWAVSYAVPVWWFAAALAGACGIGLLFNKRWSQPLWHVLALLVSVAWLISVAKVALAGWPHDSALRSVVSLVPGLLLLFVCAGGSIIVVKHFRGKANAL